jgi:hypothetical protein
MSKRILKKKWLLWPKEGSRVKLAIWLLNTKSYNHPNLLVFRWCAPYLWKALNEGYNFSLDLISIWGLNKKLWVSKVARIPISGILETKWHLGACPVPWPSTKNIIRREGDGFPQVWAVVSLVNSCLPTAHPCTKSASIVQ